MQMYLRVILDQAAETYSASEEQQLRQCIASAPGVTGVTKIERHAKGGYSVIVDRSSTPEEALLHLAAAGYKSVL